jgi:hypothetical protein
MITKPSNALKAVKFKLQNIDLDICFFICNELCRMQALNEISWEVYDECVNFIACLLGNKDEDGTIISSKTYTSWLYHQGFEHISNREANEGRLLWLDWMIAQYEAIGQ